MTVLQRLLEQFPKLFYRENLLRIRELFRKNREFNSVFWRPRVHAGFDPRYRIWNDLSQPETDNPRA
jgi:hypothetical protein